MLDDLYFNNNMVLRDRYGPKTVPLQDLIEYHKRHHSMELLPLQRKIGFMDVSFFSETQPENLFLDGSVIYSCIWIQPAFTICLGVSFRIRKVRQYSKDPTFLDPEFKAENPKRRDIFCLSGWMTNLSIEFTAADPCPKHIADTVSKAFFARQRIFSTVEFSSPDYKKAREFLKWEKLLKTKAKEKLLKTNTKEAEDSETEDDVPLRVLLPASCDT